MLAAFSKNMHVGGKSRRTLHHRYHPYEVLRFLCLPACSLPLSYCTHLDDYRLTTLLQSGTKKPHPSLGPLAKDSDIMSRLKVLASSNYAGKLYAHASEYPVHPYQFYDKEYRR